MVADPGAGPDETDLIARLRAGDDVAFEQVVRREGGRLLAVARRILRDEEEARDAVQETFLSAWRGLDRFDGASRLSTWLYRIAVNAALMRRRRRGARPETSIDALLPRFDDTGHWAEPPAPWSADGLERLEREETRQQVRAAIDRLPETHRTVLMLRDIEGLDTAETAAVLELNPGAVKVRLHRARQALRALLEPVLHGESRS